MLGSSVRTIKRDIEYLKVMKVVRCEGTAMSEKMDNIRIMKCDRVIPKKSYFIIWGFGLVYQKVKKE